MPLSVAVAGLTVQSPDQPVNTASTPALATKLTEPFRSTMQLAAAPLTHVAFGEPLAMIEPAPGGETLATTFGLKVAVQVVLPVMLTPFGLAVPPLQLADQP